MRILKLDHPELSEWAINKKHVSLQKTDKVPTQATTGDRRSYKGFWTD